MRNYIHFLNKCSTGFRWALVLSLLSLASCDTNGEKDKKYELVWSDEFDGNAGSLPTATKWSFDIGRGQDGWGNQELQYYTNRPENISLDGNGNLVIVARKENFSGAAYTSARIKTKGIFSTTFGKIEARIKLPFGKGLWPAFWMLGNSIDTVGWPQCGEIDIMEARGQEPQTVHGSVHGPGFSGGNAVTSSYTLSASRFDNDFHIFSVIWDAYKIEFYVDDNRYQTITPDDLPGDWVFDDSFYLLLNMAVGGSFVGGPTDTTPFPQEMTVDYVRVYQ